MDPNTEAAVAASLRTAANNNRRRQQIRRNNAIATNHAVAASMASEEERLAIRRRQEQMDIDAATAESIYTNEVYRARLAAIEREFERQMEIQRREPVMPTIIYPVPIEGLPVSPRTLAAIDALNAPTAPRAVTVKDAGGGGDCFYLSLAAALRERGLVQRVGECLGMQPSANRLLYTDGIRNLVADSVTQQASRVYSYLAGLIDRRGTQVDLAIQMETQQIIMRETFAEWHRLAFYSAPNREEYIRRIAAGIRVRGNWASEIEVKTLTQLLALCNIDLVVYNNNRVETLPQVVAGREKIYLYNQGNVHFQYFSFAVVGGRTRRGRTHTQRRRTQRRRTQRRHL